MDTEPAPEPTSPTLTLTQDGLDRRVQAETDRREAKRQREAADKTERERREAIDRKLDPASPEYDPHGGAEERAQLRAAEEASQHFSSLLQDISKQHDAVTLDVIKDAVPQAEWDRISALEGAGVGLDGRRLIVTEGLKALEKHWKAEGARETETKLKSDPVFRKRVFTEHRGDVEEPELVPGSASRNGNDFMDLIRTDYLTAKRKR